MNIKKRISIGHLNDKNNILTMSIFIISLLFKQTSPHLTTFKEIDSFWNTRIDKSIRYNLLMISQCESKQVYKLWKMPRKCSHVLLKLLLVKTEICYYQNAPKKDMSWEVLINVMVEKYDTKLQQTRNTIFLITKCY